MIDGIELVVSPASFAEVMAMKEAIVSTLKENGIKIDLSSVDIGEENLTKMELGDVGWILDPILTIASNSVIRKHLFKCAERAMFGKDKVNEDFFEDPDNRKYYYPIMLEVLKINIAPFFGLAGSLFKKLGPLTEKFLKSKSQPQN